MDSLLGAELMRATDTSSCATIRSSILSSAEFAKSVISMLLPINALEDGSSLSPRPMREACDEFITSGSAEAAEAASSPWVPGVIWALASALERRERL